MWPWSTIRKLKDDLDYTKARFFEEHDRAEALDATNAVLTERQTETFAAFDALRMNFDKVEAIRVDLERARVASLETDRANQVEIKRLTRMLVESDHDRNLAISQAQEAQRRYEESHDLASRLTEQLAQAAKNDKRDPRTGRFVKSGPFGLQPNNTSHYSEDLEDINGRLA